MKRSILILTMILSARLAQAQSATAPTGLVVGSGNYFSPIVADLEKAIAFYRDGLGLAEIGGFRDHDGYDGVFLEVPGTGAHLELTAGGGQGPPEPHPESLLVFYLGDEREVRTVVERLGIDPVEPANPYWAEHGVTLCDPDGFRVVLVPETWG